MAAPNSLKGTDGQWVITNRPHDCIYEMDPVDSLDLVGRVTKNKLEKQGLVAVKDIRDLLREQVESIAKLDKLGFQQQAKSAILGHPPEKTNYRKANNPWKAWYGKNWEAKLDQSSLMSPYCSIKTLVENMVSDCQICSKEQVMSKTGFSIMMRSLS
jgi:hypothetical protein